MPRHFWGHGVTRRGGSKTLGVLTGVTALAVALTLTACAPAARDSAPPSATAHATAPKPTPQPSEITLGPQETGDAFDRVLADKYPYQSLRDATVGAPVSLYFPGSGSVRVDATMYANGHDVTNELVSIAGPEKDPVAVLAMETRIPASGLDPESYRLELVTLGSTGKLLNRFVVINSDNSAFAQPDTMAGSHSNVVAVQTSVKSATGGDYPDVVTTGWNILTGKKVWQQAAGMDSATFGTVAMATDSGETDGDGNACYNWEGLDIATGSTVWTIAASKYRDVNDGRCNDSRAVAYAGSAQHSSLTVILSDHSVAYGANRYVGFTSSGAPLTLPDGDEKHQREIYDPITGYLAHDDGQGGTVVTDPSTGKTIFSVTPDRASSLNLSVLGFYAGLLFTKTTDGQPVVKVTSGKVVMDKPSVYPVAQVGKWTLYNDGVLRIKPDLLMG